MKKLLLRITGLGILFLIGGIVNTGLMAQQESSSPKLVSNKGAADGQEGTMVSLADLLTMVEQNFEATFLFKNELVQQKWVNADKIQMGEAENTGPQLAAILDQLGLTYSQVDEQTYVLLPKKNPLKKVAAQEQVSGTVTDAQSGKTLPGVNILVKGTSTGTSTDSEGNFELSVPSLQDTLVFSFVGYKEQSIPIDGRIEFNIVMQQQSISAQEMVVIGYGTQQKSDLTGSVASVSADNLSDQPVTSFEQSLAGQMSGVRIQQGTGAPGDAPTVRIRGTGSISAGNEPLYVIDGFAGVDNLSSINPNNIKSINVLKDASAAAIYGSRGSNGVVIVETKSGQKGQTEINLQVQNGFQEVANKFDVLNAEQWVNLFVEARNNGWLDAGGNISDPNEARPSRYQIPPSFSDPASFGKGTDWQDEIFRVAPTQSYDLSVSGGGDEVQYFVSGNFSNEKGVIENSGFKRYSFQAKLNLDLTKNIEFGFNVIPSYTETDRVKATGHWGSNGIILSALNQPPIFSPYNNNDGGGNKYNSLINFGWGTPSIPSPLIPVNEMSDQNEQTNIVGISYAKFKILDAFQLKSSFSIENFNSSINTFRTSQAESDGNPAPTIPEASYSTENNINWQSETTLNFKQNLYGKHSINALIGFSAQKDNLENSYIFADNFPNDEVRTLNAGQVTDGNSFASSWTLLSFLGRVNYTYDEKYLLTATLRRDGSSRFGEGTKWGLFPSAAIGWRISQESFMEKISFISGFKLRASYGLTGNNSIPNYGAIGLLDIDKYVFGRANSSNVVNGIVPTSIPNPDLGWEKTRELNIGFDLGLFQDRILIEANRYIRNTDGLLLNVPIPSITGYKSTLKNIGEVKNSGWEFSINTRNLVNDFQWSTNFNISVNQNEVLALGPEGKPIFAGSHDSHKTEIGSPIGSYFGYIFDGIFNTEEEVNTQPHLSTASPGDPIIRDVNGDGEITADDRSLIGNNQPDFTFGFTNTFNYKNIDLRILLQGVQGSQVQTRDYTWLYITEGKMNTSADLLNRWRSPENPGNGKVPRADSFSDGLRREPNTLWVQDASFLRVRNIALGYTLPKNLLKSSPLGSVRIYFSAQNAFTFTNYNGYNPEINVRTNNSINPGVQSGGYPIARVYTLGLNISL